MKLLGVEYGQAMCAAGARGFDGKKAFRHHRYLGPFGPRWRRSTLMSKTTPLPPWQGNMDLDQDLLPKELFPRCIYVVFTNGGHILNAVRLSSPGLYNLLFERRIYQGIEAPAIHSLAAVSGSKGERLEEWRGCVELFKRAHRDCPFAAPYALQANWGCPNIDHDYSEVFQEIGEVLDILGELTDLFNVPILANFSAAAPARVAIDTAAHRYCAGLVLGNTFEFGHKSIKEEEWLRIFGTKESPLLKRKLRFPLPGGYSGPAATPLTIALVGEVRGSNSTIPIGAGNSVRSTKDVDSFFDAGADFVFLGTMANFRPWAVGSTIDYINAYEVRRHAA